VDAKVKGVLLGSRLALFVVSAVIFAPGWYERGRPEPAHGADLAARILAPTWDDGAVTPAAAEAKTQPRGQYLRRLQPTTDVAYLTGVMRAALAFAFLWLFTSGHARPVVQIRHSSRLSRAPPPLQLA
jgi:hypothetical protein